MLPDPVDLVRVYASPLSRLAVRGNVVVLLVYLLVRGGSMHERSIWQFQPRNLGSRSYFPDTAADPQATRADQLEKLAGLRDRDVITADEFDREKARILA
jgi:hypothetical protein